MSLAVAQELLWICWVRAVLSLLDTKIRFRLTTSGAMISHAEVIAIMAEESRREGE